MDRLLSEQEQKALWNIPEMGHINRLLAAQLSKTDTEWVEKLNSNYRICNSGMCGYRTDKCQMLRTDDGEMGEFSCAWWQTYTRSIGL